MFILNNINQKMKKINLELLRKKSRRMLLGWMIFTKEHASLGTRREKITLETRSLCLLETQNQRFLETMGNKLKNCKFKSDTNLGQNLKQILSPEEHYYK
jgi:hypothetical protein